MIVSRSFRNPEIEVDTHVNNCMNMIFCADQSNSTSVSTLSYIIKPPCSFPPLGLADLIQ